MNIDLSILYKRQEELDDEIARNHNINYETTFARRFLALLVEFGELANETRCFKYWSNKKSSPKEVVSDEYSDGLHFLLSLGIVLNPDKKEYELAKNKEDLTEQFVKLYSLANVLYANYNLNNYYNLMQYYLNLALSIDMDSTDIINSYLKKLDVNHNRQKNNY